MCLVDGKECCIVIDFVGNLRFEYDFINKFRVFVGKSNWVISEEIKEGFFYVFIGCCIELIKWI